MNKMFFAAAMIVASIANRMVVVVGMGVVAMLMLPPNAGAVPSAGWRELAVQIPDINLKPGVPAYLPVELKTVDIDNTLPTDNGLFAMSNVPGLSIISAYGYATKTTIPPNMWAPIGEAEFFVPGTTPWVGHENGVTGISIQKFAIVFDGTAPNATQGKILIAVNEGGETEFYPRIIGSINVFVFLSPAPAWFSVTGTSATVSGSRLILNHPYLDGNIDANLFVSHVYNSPKHAPMYWNHPVSVAYDTSLNKWTIVNDDFATMPIGITFNVRIDPSAIVVRSPTMSRNGICLITTTIPIDHPSANSNPYATIIVTPRSPDASPIAVKYIAPTWYIVHADGSVPACGTYNVQVAGFSEYFTLDLLIGNALDLFVSNGAGVSIEGTPSGPRNLPFWWQLGKSDEPIIVTHNLTPPATFMAVVQTDPVFIGLSYSGGSTPQWQIIHEDGTAVPMHASFNTWGQPQLTP